MQSGHGAMLRNAVPMDTSYGKKGVDVKSLRDLLAAVLLGFPALAAADPCPGASPFTDVARTDGFCTNTEWLRNRGVTVGCTATAYCPNDPVSRAQMALFMNRLGVALTPSPQMTEAGLGAIDLDVESFVCASSVYTIAGYPRQIVLNAHFSGLTSAAADYNVEIRYNTDGSATVFPNAINAFSQRAGSDTANWTHASVSATLPLGVGTSYRFAVRVIREGAGTGDLTIGRCHLLQTLLNRNPTTSSPLDQLVAIQSGLGDE